MSMPTVGLSAITDSADCDEAGGGCNASCARASKVKTRFNAKITTPAKQRSMLFPSPDLIRLITSLHGDGVIYADSKLVISRNANDRKLEGNPGLRVAGFVRLPPVAGPRPTAAPCPGLVELGDRPRVVGRAPSRRSVTRLRAPPHFPRPAARHIVALAVCLPVRDTDIPLVGRQPRAQFRSARRSYSR